MSRIKPHGPVSPHFMNHYYGAAKPAPASDDTTLLRQALEALEIGYASAKAEADHYHAAMAGYRPHHHAQMDADVQQIAAAITALRERLGAIK